MAGMIDISLAKDALIVLGATGIVVPLFQRRNISPILAFIFVGFLVGPFGLGALTSLWPPLAYVTIEDAQAIQPMGDMGIVFLMFMIGIELSWERITTTKRLIFGFGGLQVIATTLLLTLALSALDLPWREAAIVGLALAMSSTAVILQVLVDEKRLASLAGRATFAVLLFQDLAVVPILFAVSFIGAPETMQDWSELGERLAGGVLAIVLILGLGRLALRPLFRSVAQTGRPESFMAMSLLVVLATGLATTFAGLPAALGALIAGLLLAETEYRRQIEVTIEPFKGLLLGVFLIAIGMGLDIKAISAAPLTVIGLCLSLIVLKTGLIALIAWALGLTWRVGLRAGLLLGPGGEFGFVILGLALSQNLISSTLEAQAVLIATITMSLIPSLSRLSRLWMPARVRAAQLETELPAPKAGRVVIAGFGRVGRVLADMLDAHQVPFVAFDNDADRVARERKKGRPVYFGDMTRVDILGKLDLDEARALAVTVNDQEVAERLVQAARALNPNLVITARARDVRHAAKLYQLGATDAVPETTEASLQLSEAVLVDIGVPMGLVIASIHDKRAALQAETKAMAPSARTPVHQRRTPA